MDVSEASKFKQASNVLPTTQVYTHIRVGEFGDVRVKVIGDALSSTRESDPSEEQDQQHEVRKHSCEIHHLTKIHKHYYVITYVGQKCTDLKTGMTYKTNKMLLTCEVFLNKNSRFHFFN